MANFLSCALLLLLLVAVATQSGEAFLRDEKNIIDEGEKEKLMRLLLAKASSSQQRTNNNRELSQQKKSTTAAKQTHHRRYYESLSCDTKWIHGEYITSFDGTKLQFQAWIPTGSSSSKNNKPKKSLQKNATTSHEQKPPLRENLRRQNHHPSSASSASKNKYPVVILPSSWMCPVEEYILPSRHLAELCMIAIQIEPRGWYSSGGTIDVAGPDTVRDMSAVIDYALNQSDWNADVNNIAFVGVSQGAGIGLMAGGTDPRVKTVIAMSGWLNLTQNVFQYNSPATGTISSLLGTAKKFGKPSPELIELSQMIFEHRNLSYAYDYGNARTPLALASNYIQRNISVLFSHNFDDFYFCPTRTVELFQQLNGAGGIKKLILNQGAHAEPEALGLTDVIPKSPKFIWQEVDRWLQFFLQGIDTGIMQEPLVRAQTGNTMWETDDYHGFSSWPPPSSELSEVPFYLSSRNGGSFGGLSSKKQTNSQQQQQQQEKDSIHFAFASTDDDSLSPGSSIQNWLQPAGIDVQHIKLRNVPKDSAIIFLSSEFSQDTLVCGTPTINSLSLIVTGGSNNNNRFQISAYLFDSDSGFIEKDYGRILSWIPYSDYSGAGSSGVVTISNWQMRSLCTVIKKGHQLALGFSLYNYLFEDASNSTGLSVQFLYNSQQQPATLMVPIVPSS